MYVTFYKDIHFKHIKQLCFWVGWYIRCGCALWRKNNKQTVICCLLLIRLYNIFQQSKGCFSIVQYSNSYPTAVCMCNDANNMLVFFSVTFDDHTIHRIRCHNMIIPVQHYIILQSIRIKLYLTIVVGNVHDKYKLNYMLGYF